MKMKRRKRKKKRRKEGEKDELMNLNWLLFFLVFSADHIFFNFK